MLFLLERYKEGIEVSHEKGETKEKRNEKRHEAIITHFNHQFVLNKNQFNSYIKENKLDQQSQHAMEKINQLDFTKANPRNKAFMNELSFAGGAIAEGFLECFSIERDEALRNYTSQLQVIEKKEEGKSSKFYIGTFIKNRLTRLTPYSDNKEALDRDLTNQQERLARKQQENKQMKERSLNLTRREED